MKQKHLNTLRNYLKYGEGYSAVNNYESKNFRTANYGRTKSSQPEQRWSKLSVHEGQKHALTNLSKIALCGASIVKGLERYNDVWQKHFVPLKTINLGIPGDKTQHILWRMEDIELPSSIEFFFIHCGTNNILSSKAEDIADGILSIGAVVKEKHKDVKVIVGGLLPCQMDGQCKAATTSRVNKYLRQRIRKMKDFFLWMKATNG